MKDTVQRLTLLVILLAAGLGGGLAAQAAETPMTLEALLEAVRDGRTEDRRTGDVRLAQFNDQRSERESMLAEITARREALEALSASRESLFEENDLLLSDLETRLQERMGSLKELFGVLQQAAGDAQAQFYGSLTQLEHADRTDFLVDFAGRMGQANRLPAISEIERLWFELQQEMTESGQVVAGKHLVVTSEGAEVEQLVTRVGLFNAVADGKYLKFIPETGRLVEYARQPSGRHMVGVRAMANRDAGTVPLAIDPVRGQLLDILTQAPDLFERISQGGAIGYTILALGGFGVLFALVRMAMLMWQGHAINGQLNRLDEPRDDNALGRILLAARTHDIMDVDTLELRMGEAVMRETPRINAYIPFLKIIAAVAPLMGLLGTVTGMIITFQAITLFGAGDPRLMAGGISQALVTTVLGLCVAVPMLLLHNLVHMRARSLTEILQQKAVAMVAKRAEAEFVIEGAER
jgi:biopolymer transport protein ExbB